MVMDERAGREVDGGAEQPGAVSVTEATEVTPELTEALARLVPQLSDSTPPPTGDELAEIVGAPSSVLFVARTGDGTIVGSLTLALFRAPTGLRAWIEDVVVDQAARGVGAGEALVVEALHRAAAEGAKSVDLTSRPTREAANRLYARLGFEARQTNIYRYRQQ